MVVCCVRNDGKTMSVVVLRMPRRYLHAQLIVCVVLSTVDGVQSGIMHKRLSIGFRIVCCNLAQVISGLFG